MEKQKDFLIETLKIVIIALLIVLPVRHFLFQPFVVRGASMEPSFQEGDYLLIDQLSYRFSEPERGDTIVFRYPNDPSRRYIKRIIGLPEEKLVIRNGEIYVEEERLQEDYILKIETFPEKNVTLGEEEFFVIGDNRNASFDSREWGALPREYIIGRVFFRTSFSNSVFARVEAPSY